MANDNNGASEGNGAAPAEAPAQPKLQFLTQYIRDMSFENIAVQKGAATEGKPDVQVQVNIDAKKRAEDRYEVALKLRIDSKISDTPMFILELDFAGLFSIENVPADQLHPLLMIECPRLIFPFLRRIVGDITRDGGYPPLNLEIIDFVALYRAEIARRQAAEAESKAPPAQA
jgi:preprotein translocase subunit SecB